MKPGIYRHYKGNLYQLLGLALHSETHEEMVVYQALYASYGLWVRPAAMFEEEISYNGVTMPRFTYVGKSWEQAPKID